MRPTAFRLSLLFPDAHLMCFVMGLPKSLFAVYFSRLPAGHLLLAQEKARQMALQDPNLLHIIRCGRRWVKI